MLKNTVIGLNKNMETLSRLSEAFGGVRTGCGLVGGTGPALAWLVEADLLLLVGGSGPALAWLLEPDLLFPGESNRTSSCLVGGSGPG